MVTRALLLLALATAAGSCLAPLPSEPGDNLECIGEEHPGLGVVVRGKLRYAFAIEGGEIRVTGDVEEPLRCKIAP